MSKSSSKIRGKNSSPRACIIDILCSCENGAYANELVPARLSASTFSPQDRALITRVVYFTLRHQIRIDYALTKVSTRPLPTLDITALCALRGVIAQLMDGFAMHAVVDETIKSLPFSLKGFVNAISRTAIQLYEKDELFSGEDENTHYGVPPWIGDEIRTIFTDQAPQVFDALNHPARVTLAPLTDDGLTLGDPGELVPRSRMVSSGHDVSQLLPVASGHAIVVDQASQFIVDAIDAHGRDVYDVCCAPGGKSFLLSQRARHVTSCDISYSRLSKMIDTRTRVKVSNLDVVVSDARHLPFPPHSCERILVDAPCSGLGVLRRRPDARHRITRETVEELVVLQKEILASAIECLSPGGQLIYSVCTFTRAETVEVARWIRDNYPHLMAIEQTSTHPDVIECNRGHLITPTADHDGMYYVTFTSA